MVYLAPKGVGRLEVDRLRSSSRFRTAKDSVVHVSWEALEGYPDSLEEADPDRAFITSGFEQIFKVIEESRREQYPLVGERVLVEELIQRALKQLQERHSHVRLQTWRARDLHHASSAREDE